MISDKAYKAADLAIKAINNSNTGKITMEEVDNIILKVHGLNPKKMTQKDWDKWSTELGDFDADVRTILSMNGYATNFESGDVTGGRQKKYLKYSTNPMKQYKMKQSKLNRLSRGY